MQDRVFYFIRLDNCKCEARSESLSRMNPGREANRDLLEGIIFPIPLRNR